MKRYVLILISIFIHAALFAQSDSVAIVNADKNIHDPFPSLVYDQVVAYNIGFDTVSNKRTFRGYITPAQFNYNEARKSSIRTLKPELVKKLKSIVSAPSTYGENYGDCFEPRLAVTFLNEGEAVFTMLICFECNFLESTISLPAARKKFYDSTINGGDETETVIVRRYMKGFSKKGRKKLLEFCKSLNMKYCG